MGRKPKNTPETSFLTSAQAELQAQLAVLQVRRAELRAGSFDKDLAMAASALGRAITGLAAEMRQQEKHGKQVVAAMSAVEQHALVAEYLKNLPVEDRAAFRAILDELDSTESVL